MEKIRRFNRDIPDLLLSKFQTRDLLRMKCVSKAWRELISDSTFVLNHWRQRQRQSPPLSGFFFLQKSERVTYDFSDASYISAGREELPKLVKTPLDFVPEDFVLTSSCNGLVLVCHKSFSLCENNTSSTIRVGNPITREWIDLDWNRSVGRAIAIVLSFDPCRGDVNDDGLTEFKVLIVWDGVVEDWLPSFHVYSSKTRSWKELVSDEPYNIMCQYYHLYQTECVSVKGVMHWLTDGDEMLAFDLVNEVAYTVSTPVPATVYNGGDPTALACIGESNGELHYVMVSNDGLRIWVLEDCREGKWSSPRYVKSLADIKNEHAELSLDTMAMVPMAFKDGVLLLRVSDNVFLYDTSNNSMNRVARVSEFGSGMMFDAKVFPYSMSFVPMNRGHE